MTEDDKAKSLDELKADAIEAERKRVFEDDKRPPRDIVVRHGGRTYIKRAWQSDLDKDQFGWDDEWAEYDDKEGPDLKA